MESNQIKFLTLGIESSCDDTSIAVIDDELNVLAEKTASQIDSHKIWGGVIPELASRMHQEAIMPLLDDVLTTAGVKNPSKEISLIAATTGPGLMGSLLVGAMTARALSFGWNVPFTAVNHLEGHIFANLADAKNITPPFISLIISGGHTEIVWVKDFGNYELLGTTRDDAVGEAFDKLSKFLDLGYPGGPVLDKLAQTGQAIYNLPTPLCDTKEIEFSFSGLKTAAINLATNLKEDSNKLGKNFPLNDLAASFQNTVCKILTSKLALAFEKTGVKTLTISGGVAANSAIRSALQDFCNKRDITLYMPQKHLCTDNGIMIALAGYFAYKRGEIINHRVSPSWSLW